MATANKILVSSKLSLPSNKRVQNKILSGSMEVKIFEDNSN